MLKLFRRKPATVATLTASLSKMASDLLAHEWAELDRADALRDQAEALIRQSSEADAEAARAGVVAAKLEALLK